MAESPGDTAQPWKIRLFNFLPNGIRNHFIAMMGEFAGTFLFLLLALGGTNVVNAAPLAGRPADLAANPAKLLYIAFCFGFSLAVNAWIFFRISGGLFNPAVSVGMMVVGAVPYVRGCLAIVSQILGGIAASAVVSAMLPGPLNVRTALGGGTSVVQGLFIEMFLTAQLVFAIFMLAAGKHRGTLIAPVGIGLSLFIAELFGVYYTGGSLNLPRSFGPCVVLHSFYYYHWICWVGPILGSLLASGFYMFIKALEYETANPDQDSTGSSDAHHFDPTTGKETTRPVGDPDKSSDSMGGSREGQISSAGRVSSDVPTLLLPFTSAGNSVHDTVTTEKDVYRHAPDTESGCRS